MKSYFLESFCYLLRSFVRGSIQGIAIQSYLYQLIALIVSDVFFVLMVLLFSKKFVHKSVIFLLLIFHIGFLLLDIVLLCYFRNPDLFKNIDYNLFIFVFISILIVLYLSIIGTIFFKNILSTIKNISNKKGKRVVKKQ